MTNSNFRLNSGRQGDRPAAGTANGQFYLSSDGLNTWDATLGVWIFTPTSKLVTWSPVDTHNAGESLGKGSATVGNSFQTLQADLVVIGVRVKIPVAGTYTCKLWLWDGTLLGTASAIVAPSAETIVTAFAAPIPLAANERYIVTVYNTAGNGYVTGTLITGLLPLAGAAAAPGNPLLTPCGAIAWAYPQFYGQGEAAPVIPDDGNPDLIAIECVFGE